MKRDAHSQSLPYITFRALSKGARPPGSTKRAPIETYFTARALLQRILKVPSRGIPLPTSPNGTLLRHPSHPSLKVPGKRTPFQVPQRGP